MTVPTYNGHFLNSRFYNFPCWPAAVKNIKAKLNTDPSGKYGVLDTIARTATTNVGYPGFSNAAIDEVFNTWVVNTMFAKAATGTLSPEDALSEAQAACARIWEKWQEKGAI